MVFAELVRGILHVPKSRYDIYATLSIPKFESVECSRAKTEAEMNFSVRKEASALG